MSRCIYTHGLKMVGLRKAAGDTQRNVPRMVYRIYYDRSSGEVWTNYYHSPNSWTEYSNDAVICVSCSTFPRTMQQVADAIAQRIAELKALEVIA